MDLKFRICLTALFLLAASVQAVSADDDSGFYAGVSINRLSADFKSISDVDFSRSDNAGGIRAGYKFFENLGIEFGYLDLGSYVAEGHTSANKLDLDATAFRVALVTSYAISDNFDIYGSIGATRLKVRSDSTVAGTRIEQDEDKTEPYGALGIEWDFGVANLFFELSKVETDISDLSIDMATLGIKYELGR